MLVEEAKVKPRQETVAVQVERAGSAPGQSSEDLYGPGPGPHSESLGLTEYPVDVR